MTALILVSTLASTVCAAAGVIAARSGGRRTSLERLVLVPDGSSGDRRRGRLGVRRRHGGARRARRVAAAIDAEIPQLLDLLAAGSSAGLSAQLALRRACDGLVGPLGHELRATLHAVDLGARWRDELESLAVRLDLPDLRRTVAALTRTETLGSSLAQATADLAASVRQARRAETSERARTAPVKMLFPLVFLVLPAFLLLTVVPVLLTTVRSIR